MQTVAERPGLLDHQGVVRDLSSVIPDLDGRALNPRQLVSLESLDATRLAVVAGLPRLGPCVARPGKFICIGLPKEPVVFLKATSALSGPYDPIIQPRDSTKLDWEVELAFVIGTECRYVVEGQGAAAIAGYFVCHDVSERAFQLERGGQWDKGKGCASFGPIGS